MKKLIIICVTAGLIFALGIPVANGAISYGTPSPSLSPTFGTLVDFDDKAPGTLVLSNDYVSVGVASITETTGAGILFARYPSFQSLPSIIGTGNAYEIGGASGGWDGTIRIDLALPASMVGIGVVANNAGGSEFLSVYDSIGSLLETHPIASGTFSQYVVITRGAYDISRLEISGDLFAVDDLQFNAGPVVIPVPGAIILGSIGAGLVGWLRRRRTL